MRTIKWYQSIITAVLTSYKYAMIQPNCVFEYKQEWLQTRIEKKWYVYHLFGKNERRNRINSQAGVKL